MQPAGWSVIWIMPPVPTVPQIGPCQYESPWLLPRWRLQSRWSCPLTDAPDGAALQSLYSADRQVRARRRSWAESVRDLLLRQPSSSSRGCVRDATPAALPRRWALHPRRSRVFATRRWYSLRARQRPGVAVLRHLALGQRASANYRRN